MGKRWSKDERSQALPTLYPGNAGEGWEMGGRKMGKARHFPPYSQTNRAKDGNRGGQKMEEARHFPR